MDEEIKSDKGTFDKKMMVENQNKNGHYFVRDESEKFQMTMLLESCFYND